MAKAAQGRVDEKYYEVAPPNSLGERLVVAARDRIFDDFLRHARPTSGDSILDIGVSDVINDGANLLERRYPHPERITAVGIGEGVDFRMAFPLVRYQAIEPGRPLPFSDHSFDVATSNAVLEHVGSREAQVAMLADMLRVAKRVFLTVPHRYFPVEHHTAIPLLHYSDTAFRVACRALGKGQWADEKNLILMTRRRLASLVPPGVEATIAMTGLMLGPLSSNLLLYIDARHLPAG
jgi:SAM-dependent methyltransferase